MKPLPWPPPPGAAPAPSTAKARPNGVDNFAAGTRVPVYRFYVPVKGVHFYTASEAEKQAVQTGLAAPPTSTKASPSTPARPLGTGVADCFGFRSSPSPSVAADRSVLHCPPFGGQTSRLEHS